jgi:hypothetical protein
LKSRTRGNAIVDQTVDELEHPVASQRHGAGDGHALAHLEGGDRLLRPAIAGFCPTMRPSSSAPSVEDLDVLGGFADAHVHHHACRSGARPSTFA